MITREELLEKGYKKVGESLYSKEINSIQEIYVEFYSDKSVEVTLYDERDGFRMCHTPTTNELELLVSILTGEVRECEWEYVKPLGGFRVKNCGYRLICSSIDDMTYCPGCGRRIVVRENV